MATAPIKPTKPRRTAKAVPVRSAMRVRTAPPTQSIRAKYGLSQKLLAQLLGAPTTNLARWEKSDSLPPEVRAKSRTIAELLRSLARSIPMADLAGWLTKPNDACRSAGEHTPAELFAKGRFDQIEAMIYFFESGAAY